MRTHEKGITCMERFFLLSDTRWFESHTIVFRILHYVFSIISQFQIERKAIWKDLWLWCFADSEYRPWQMSLKRVSICSKTFSWLQNYTIRLTIELPIFSRSFHFPVSNGWCDKSRSLFVIRDGNTHVRWMLLKRESPDTLISMLVIELDHSL